MWRERKELAHTIVKAEKSKVCHLHTRDPGEPVVPFGSSLRPVNLGSHAVSDSLRPGEDEMRCPAQTGRRKRVNSSVLWLLFYSGSGWIGWCPHWGGQSSVLSSLVQMPIASRNILTDTPRNNVNLGTPQPVKLTHKINTTVYIYPSIYTYTV